MIMESYLEALIENIRIRRFNGNILLHFCIHEFRGNEFCYNFKTNHYLTTHNMQHQMPVNVF